LFEKIIVPLDGSENSEKVLPYVEELARQTNAELIFTGVCSECEQAFENLFKKYILEQHIQSKKKGIQARSIFLNGNPSEEIIKYADSNSADLIALSTHGRSGFKEWILGGVSEKILLHSSKPVLLISPKGKKEKTSRSVTLQNILVPLDGSALGAMSLPVAKELVKRTNGKIFLLNVILSTQRVIGIMNYATGFERQLANALHEQAQQYITGIAADLEKEGFESRYDLIDGIPSEEILKYANKNSIDLIVMSTHGMSAASQAVMGSVAHQVVHNSAIPVLIVPAQLKKSRKKK
jgi:nucleotide-binding universal stress UspA family protein